MFYILIKNSTNAFRLAPGFTSEKVPLGTGLANYASVFRDFVKVTV